MVKSRFWFLLVMMILGLALTLQIFVNLAAGDKDFKLFAESRVGDFLNADVSIGNIHVNPFNHISLTGLQIHPQTAEKSPYRVDIHTVTFRYNLLQVIARKIKRPSEVVFEKPKIELGSEIFPYSIFDRINFSGKKDGFALIEIVGGTLIYPLASLDDVVKLEEFSGVFRPDKDGKMQVDFKARMKGFMNGMLHIYGEINLEQRTHDLHVVIESAEFGPRLTIPFKNISGQMTWRNDGFYFDDIQSSLYGWKMRLKGHLIRLMSKPVLQLHLGLNTKEDDRGYLLEADLGDERLHAEWGQFRGKPLQIDGRILQDGNRFLFKDLTIMEDYTGQGFVDFASGQYQMSFSKERQEISVFSNLKGLDSKIQLQLQHVNFYGLDVVTKAYLEMKTGDPGWQGRQWRFGVDFKTDYFILEYTPLDDFKGRFELNPYGIKNIVAGWGQGFGLNGDVSFGSDEPVLQWILKVDGFDLKDVKKMANKPLPKDIAGILEGKLKIEGPVDGPEVIGDFTIRQGLLGKLNYDLGILHFRGFSPYMRLYDSVVMKGRTSFSLEGVIDLSLQNVWHGIQIKTPEKYVIWKGLEASTDKSERDLEIGKSDDSQKALMVKALETSDAGDESGSLKDEQESSLVVGTKFKF